jgi:DNA-binding transcriptional MocR family regulator
MDPYRRVSAVRPDVAAALFREWPDASAPVSRRLAASIGAAVRDGRIPLGSRLPSERALAARLDVGRKAVATAYARLVRDGLAEARHGSGHYTRAHAGAALIAPFPVGAIDGAHGLDLSLAAPMDAAPEIRDVVHAVAETGIWQSHGFVPLGLGSLRRAIADRYTAAGAPTSPDQILITNGAQHAIQLAVQTLVGPRDPVLVESPTFPLVLDALRARRAALISTYVDARDGWDLDEIQMLLAEHRPRLAVLIPDCHMPTGRRMSEADRERLVAAARGSGTTLLIDETLAEIHDGGPLRPVAAFGAEGVVTVGSFSKTAWGGLRVGWARANRFEIQRMAQVRASLDVAGPPLDQLVAHLLLERWPAILARRRVQAAGGRAVAGEALERLLPAWRWHPPEGGLCLWVHLPGPVSTALAEFAPAHGLRLVPGSRFALDRDLERYLRVPFVLPEPELVAAIERLAALDASLETAPPPADRSGW